MTGSRWRRWWDADGGPGELLRLALPLILSHSAWTLQITLNRVFLTWYRLDAIEAALPTVLIFWTLLTLFQATAAYAGTFVAQYLGAGRPHRLGPAVWQGLYFALGAGIAFLGLLPLAEPLLDLGGHPPHVRALEVAYFRCLSFAALPTLVLAAANSFFTGRGRTWVVLGVEGVGLVVNGLLDYALIFGHWGFPEWGIAGAGWATAAGMSASALLALFFLFRPHHEAEFRTRSGWRFDPALFRRLMAFGLPSGVQMALDASAFTAFTFLVGRLGEAELAATNIAFAINLFVCLPMFGIGHAVTVLVGRRLGEDRPDLAARTTWTAFGLTWVFMATVGLLCVLVPEAFLYWFRNPADPLWPQVAPLVPILLRFVAVYSLFDSMNLVFSFALKGAGDTRFVTVITLGLAWLILVLPTWLTYVHGWGLYWAWTWASAYVVTLGLAFLLRFQRGSWKALRVIESAHVTGTSCKAKVQSERFENPNKIDGTHASL